MGHTKKVGTSGRFGVRYGRTTRKKIADIEALYRGYHKCTNCNKKRVKRIAFGIWKCYNCDLKFARKAYLFE
ncbi:50S ribosomal protein L37ae [Candidatus Woesearchaeota archaeon]|nr:50S ribosomal protein L37ae [Candidatus Woesearchaeota archaeon]